MTRPPRASRGVLLLVVTVLVVACLGGLPAATGAAGGEGSVSARPLPSPKKVLKKNPIYKGKALKERACARNPVPLDSAAHLTEYYLVLKACLDKAWKKKVKKAGLRWRKPRLAVWARAVSTPCGPGTVYVSFYCPSNRTMYLNVEEMMSWSADPANDGLGGRLGWLRAAFVLSHEYAHHIQTLMGVWTAVGRQVAKGKTTWAATTPATELQASCLAMAFLHSVRATYPIEETVLADWRWRVIHLDSHGSDANQMYWMSRGFATGKPKSCNVFKALAALRG